MAQAAPPLPPDDAAAQAVEEQLRVVALRFAPKLRPRVTKLLMGAAEAIVRLCDLDLVRYEGDSERGGHTIAVWEELAPLMGETVTSVNELIATTQEAFPAEPQKDLDEDLDAAFGPAPSAQEEVAELAPLDEEAELKSLVAAVTSGLRRDVTHLGERLRNPTVMSEPWNLISDLLEFRGRLRTGIGELIFQAVCLVQPDAERAAYVPGYASDLEAAVLVRKACTNLSFVFRAHTRRVAAAPQDKIAAALQDAIKDINSFSRTRALPALRTADKRILLESRAKLRELSREKPPRLTEVRQAVENLARFLDSMSVISRRENLRLHDRMQIAAVGRAIESAESVLHEPTQARAFLVQAIARAGEMYGRDPQLDTYLRAQRHFEASWLLDSEIEPELQRLSQLLAQMSPP